MHDAQGLIEARLRRTLAERINPARYRERRLIATEASEVDGEPIGYDAALAGRFEPIVPGTPWGKPWGTTWFHVHGEVPEGWDDAVELIVELGFSGSLPGFQAEGQVWADGAPRCGVHPARRAVPLPDARSGDRIDLMVEGASNPSFVMSFSASQQGSRRTMSDAPLYVWGGAWVARLDPEVDGLIHDLGVLAGVARSAGAADPRRHRILHHIERALDALDLNDVSASAAAARAELAGDLAIGARASAHRIVAVGHAHIDTAWLWPLRETVRKCARTFSSAVEMIERDPDFTFVCSQAAQYDWMETRYPALFARMRTAVAANRFIPVGGMWVEADMNLPSGESIARQLVYGQRYFESRFGRRCAEVWIPDVFGYPGSLPQIFAAGGCNRFVTQKLSWNKQNQMPHHTFWWEGIDGSRVLTHFPPVDTYNAEIKPRELAHAQTNFRDKAWSDWSLMPYGYGDGGGGPTREMLERARRCADLDGLPRITFGTPDDFFEQVEAEAQREPVPVWRGELYFEMHRGTYTTQSNTKVGNRRTEDLLRRLELWLTISGVEWPAEVLDEIWKELLILQFHDILPGSSIAWVYEDAEASYARMGEHLATLERRALGRMATGGPVVANAASHDRDEVVRVDGTPTRVRVPGLSVAPLQALPADDAVHTSERELRNGSLHVCWDDSGYLTSVVDLTHGRELLPAGSRGAVLELAPDHPVEYDAWDLESWAHRLAEVIDTPATIEIVESGPLAGAVAVTRSFGASSVRQTYRLRAGSPRLDIDLAIDWYESEKILTLDVPLAVRSDQARCEIQFGHVARPTHTNTSWDAAKFEVPAHRWVDVSEPGFGVAVLNDGRYGHAVTDGAVRVTLQRAPRYPAPEADRGHHEVTIALLPHGAGLHEVLHEAECLNLPLVVASGEEATAAGTGADGASWAVRVPHPGVLVSAVKRADDGSGDLIVRVWEAAGDRTETTIDVNGTTAAAWATNLLEDLDGARELPVEAGSVALTLGPFELATVRVRTG